MGVLISAHGVITRRRQSFDTRGVRRPPVKRLPSSNRCSAFSRVYRARARSRGRRVVINSSPGIVYPAFIPGCVSEWLPRAAAVIAPRSVYIVRINAPHTFQMPFKIMQMRGRSEREIDRLKERTEATGRRKLRYSRNRESLRRQEFLSLSASLLAAPFSVQQINEWLQRNLYLPIRWSPGAGQLMTASTVIRTRLLASFCSRLTPSGFAGKQRSGRFTAFTGASNEMECYSGDFICSPSDEAC